MSGQSRSYRGWSAIEEAKLVEILVNMVNAGLHKANNGGFKSGYLQHLELKFKETFPDTDILGKPHMESKRKTMRRDWQVVHNMFHGSSASRFGWNESTKSVSASAEVWDTYIKHHKEAAKWKNKPFPHYEDLCIVFGKDPAHENGAKVFGDVEEDADKVLESDEEFDRLMEGSPNTPNDENAQADENANVQAEEISSVPNKKRKCQSEPLVDGLQNAVIELGNTLNQAAATLSQDIEFQVDLKKKRAMITLDISKMQSLTKEAREV